MPRAPGTRAASSGASAGAARRSSHPAPHRRARGRNLPAHHPCGSHRWGGSRAIRRRRCLAAGACPGGCRFARRRTSIAWRDPAAEPPAGSRRHRRAELLRPARPLSSRSFCNLLLLAKRWSLGAHALGDGCTHERYTDGMRERLTGRASPSGTPHSAAAIRRSYSLSGTRGSSTIHSGTGARRDPLVVDKMRHALARALAVPALWVSTVAFPIMVLAYCLAVIALDSIERAVRRGRHR